MTSAGNPEPSPRYFVERPRTPTKRGRTAGANMPLISTNTIVVSVSLFHMTLGFFFLTSPGTINDLPLVNMLGAAMSVPYTPTFDAPSAPLAFLGAILFLLGLTDLTTISSLPPEVWLIHHWGSQAPLRASLSFLLCLYTWFFSPTGSTYGRFGAGDGGMGDGLGGPLAWATGTHPKSGGPGYASSSWGGDGLKNRVFFTFAFVETISWFWVWVTLKEERRELLEVKSRKARRMSQHYS